MLVGHACGVFRLLGSAPCGAVAAFCRLGVRRTRRLVTAALGAAFMRERATGVRTETATGLAWCTLAALGKPGLRALEGGVKLVVEPCARRCRPVGPRGRRLAIAATEAATVAAETSIAFAAFETAEIPFVAFATV